MPFVHSSNYASYARPLPWPKIDAIFVFNDSRDWALDIQIILDLLLSQGGNLGTTSPLNDDPSLPNRGFQQDGQPPLYFSNPDLLWAAKYHLPRLGQGGFREALEGVWNALTGGKSRGVTLQKIMFGKPHQATFEFAERLLVEHRNKDEDAKNRLKCVYMVGGTSWDFPYFCDSVINPNIYLYSISFCTLSVSNQLSLLSKSSDNPESDILGANTYNSPYGTNWHSILVRSGVHTGDTPSHEPAVIVNDVWDAVQWGLNRSQGSWCPAI